MRIEEPESIKSGLAQFRASHVSSERTAFLMMRFIDRPIFHQIHKAVLGAFQRQGIDVLRADDFYYYPEIFPNIQTYMHGCGIGIAIFDRIERNEHNPNVACEVGYMIAIGKPVCLLKERTVEALPGDFLARIYESFDRDDLEASVNRAVDTWVTRNNLAVPYTHFAVRLACETARLNEQMLKAIGAGLQSMLRQNHTWRPAELTGYENFDDDFQTVDLRFSADIKGVEHLNSLFRTNAIPLPAGYSIESISLCPSIEMVDYLGHERFDRTCPMWQICRLNAFQGHEAEAEAGKRVVGQHTSNYEEIVVWLKMLNGLLYCHSNYKENSCPESTKLMINLPVSLFYILKLIVGGRERKLSQYDLNRLFTAHIEKVRYIFDGQSLQGLPFPPLDIAGASVIECRY